MNTEKMTVSIELSEDDMRAFKATVGLLREPYDDKSMTVDELLNALVDDVIMTQTRPGSWEGANMQQVISSHGWELWRDEDE